MKKSFVLYLDQYAPIKNLSLAQKGCLLDSIFKYQTGEEVECIDEVVEMAFNFLKQTFERDKEKWEGKAKANRENGKKGGRPKKNDNNDLPENPDKPKKPTGLNGNPSKPKKAVSGSVSVSASVKKEYPWLDVELFEIFIQDRIDRKKAPTEKAIELMVKKLEKLCNGNYDLQEQIINKSIESGWTTFYPLKSTGMDFTGINDDESWKKAL